MTVVTKTLDLAPFVGVRVKVTRTVRGDRYTYYGVFSQLCHWTKETSLARIDYCGGMMRIEPFAGQWFGSTGFDLPYDDATIELAPSES